MARVVAVSVTSFLVVLGAVVVLVLDAVVVLGLGVGEILSGIYSSEGFVLFLHVPPVVVVYPIGHSSKQYAVELPLIVIYLIL